MYNSFAIMRLFAKLGVQSVKFKVAESKSNQAVASKCSVYTFTQLNIIVLNNLGDK